MSTLENIEVLYAIGTHEVSYLEGRLLTVVDACIADPEQRKALKDIVRTNVWEWINSTPMRVEKENAKFIASFEEGRLIEEVA